MKKSDITKEKILQAAEESFAEKGLYGARVDEIAALSTVNKRMIYEYFGNKEKLYTAVLERVYRRLSDSQQALMHQDLDCVDMMRRMIEHFFVFLYDNPTFVKMAHWENLNEAAYLKTSNVKSYQNLSFDLMKKVLRQGIACGAFRRDINVENTILSVHAFVYSYFFNIHTMAYIMNIDAKGRESVHEHCAYLTEMVLCYFLKK